MLTAVVSQHIRVAYVGTSLAFDGDATFECGVRRTAIRKKGVENRFQQEGARVAISGRRKKALDEAVKTIGYLREIAASLIN